MAEKQILAALQIESNEVRLIVGEVFNTRLNTLFQESVPCKGMDGFRIVDPKAVVRAIRQAVDNASAHLGTTVESVLLAIPAYRFKKETRTFSKVIDSADGRISVDDIRDIHQKAFSVNVGSDLEIVNVTSNVYKTNGIIYRKMPLGEQCDVLEADVDLLCADKMTTYDYAMVVEQAGLKIIDVCLDNYAIAKESALFEQTMNNYVLLVELEKQHTIFSLIYDGKIAISESENLGYDSLVKPIAEKSNLPEKYNLKLLLKYARVDQKNFNNRPVYSWTINQNKNTFTDKQLYDAVKPALDVMVNEFHGLCAQILDQENVTVIVAGDGTEIDGIDKVMAENFGRPVKCYYPETLGAREGKWTVCLGMIYAYIDQVEIHRNYANSVDVVKYASRLNSTISSKDHEEGFTARLKNMVFSNNKN